jgi:hypothetical protein
MEHHAAAEAAAAAPWGDVEAPIAFPEAMDAAEQAQPEPAAEQLQEAPAAAAAQPPADAHAAPPAAEAPPAEAAPAVRRAAAAPAAAAEEEDEATDSDAEAPPPAHEAPPIEAPAPAPPPLPPLPPKSGGRRGGGRGGIITLKLLIDEGVMVPGEGVLSMEYKGTSQTASLDPEGRIVTSLGGRPLVFESPSAFSIYFKRLLNPTRKADDGWKTVKYDGRLLEHYKGELARRRLGDGPLEGDTAAAAAFPPERAAKRARVGAPGGGAAAARSYSSFAAAQGSGAAEAEAAEEEAARERPRRARRAPPRFAAIGVDDEHALQPLEAYGPGEQPFVVRVCPAAEVVMDFHAHLCLNEVIGILAGTWDAEKRCITCVQQRSACRCCVLLVLCACAQPDKGHVPCVRPPHTPPPHPPPPRPPPPTPTRAAAWCAPSRCASSPPRTTRSTWRWIPRTRWRAWRRPRARV